MVALLSLTGLSPWPQPNHVLWARHLWALQEWMWWGHSQVGSSGEENTHSETRRQLHIIKQLDPISGLSSFLLQPHWQKTLRCPFYRVSNCGNWAHLPSMSSNSCEASLDYTYFVNCISPYLKKDFIYLFLEREEGKGRKQRERNIWPATQAHALTRNWTSNLLVHRPALNPLSHTSQGSASFLPLNYPRILAPCPDTSDSQSQSLLFLWQVLNID